ncbi:hypothetical protein YC2023_113523 [Brassica napus]
MERVIPQLIDPMSSLKIRGFASVYRHIRSDEESEHELLCSVLEIPNGPFEYPKRRSIRGLNLSLEISLGLSMDMRYLRGRVERERRSKIGSGELLARERACRRRSPSNYRKRCWSFASLSSPLTSALSELLFRSHPWRICFWSKSAVVWGFGAVKLVDARERIMKNNL